MKIRYLRRKEFKKTTVVNKPLLNNSSPKYREFFQTDIRKLSVKTYDLQPYFFRLQWD